MVSGRAGRRVKRAIAAIAMTLALLAAFALTSPTDARAATITGASIVSQGEAVELHFAVEGPNLGWHLSIHGQQLWIELNNARMQLPARPLFGQEIAPITTVGAFGSGGGTARIEVEVVGRTDYAIGRLPHELVLRVAPVGKVSNLAAPILTGMERRRSFARATPRKSPPTNSRIASTNGIPNPPMPAPIARASEDDHVAERQLPAASAPTQMASRPVANAEGASTLLAPRNGRPLVVIDPGHGGHDPGTEAAGEVAERDVALQIATRVRDALIADGVDVRLTRDDDTFLTLAERTQLANRNDADLFVSIHLNSSPDPDTTGIETYYLNNTTDRATIRLARMENSVAGGYSAPGQPNLNYILTDLRQQDKANESASLARMIEAEAVADINASMGLRVNQLGAKQGPFYVLVGALMPSVLVECGFLSNPGEARLLQSPQYQQGLADGIARAVIHYFNADAAVGNL
jgi:N-acetylmuramoyl-L-alanine amidase